MFNAVLRGAVASLCDYKYRCRTEYSYVAGIATFIKNKLRDGIFTIKSPPALKCVAIKLMSRQLALPACSARDVKAGEKSQPARTLAINFHFHISLF
ncbi:unnamed protein product [Peronospora belbahrii]|uniref:Uncharacterized protein n=1 Tax=Peronospora belbahrii TaxID=622444 RepID=A0AAU9L8Q1_9STRA|nr:unnamed protein product [Peronospora belbahrii]